MWAFPSFNPQLCPDRMLATIKYCWNFLAKRAEKCGTAIGKVITVHSYSEALELVNDKGKLARYTFVRLARA